MKTKSIFYFLLVSIFIWSCKDDLPEDLPPPIIEKGFVSGKINSINGLKPIGGALIFTFDDDHEVLHTYADAQGNFSLEAPVGTRTLHIQTGDGSNFRTAVDVSFVKDQTTVLDESLLRLNQVANMAYVPGAYDLIEELIVNLGYTATELTYNDLANYSTLSQFDIVFLNCGSNTLSADTDSALSQYVSNGGSLYASDWAVSYLMGDNVSGCSNSPGGFIPDEFLCALGIGNVENKTGLVSDAALLASVGFNSFSIEYDLPQWDVITSYDASYWDVLVETADSEALMIRTNNYTNGNVTGEVGNQANDGWVTICHIPPGNPNNPITITINDSALQAHLAHGDTLGACENEENNGTIYFTTFHNHAGGLNGSNSEKILEYVILNL